MDQEIPPIRRADGHEVSEICRIPNERLTKFWGRPMFLGAIVLLPQGWDSHPNARYPVLVHHGHFPETPKRTASAKRRRIAGATGDAARPRRRRRTSSTRTGTDRSSRA